MACTHDKANFKHYCRVCKKGFMCGRALGGHMRAHGIGDERGNIDEDYPINDMEEKFGGGGDRSSNRRMYQLRTNPNRLKTFRTCENCGKEFSSWKSFLEHGKCSSDDASESLISSPDSDEYDDTDVAHCSSGWSKRKRSLRSKVGSFSATSYPPSEEDDIMLARCLVQLANTVVNHIPIVDKNKGKEVVSGTSPKGMFQCKACKKVFNSHQALGGHRASHKKVKGCYAAKQDQISHRDESNGVIAMEDDAIASNEEFLIPPSKSPSSPSSLQFEQGTPSDGTARRKPKVHECSICHRVFSSGQALGGHKRCHWITSNSPLETSYLPKNNIDPVDKYHNSQHKPMIAISDKLDLNVPAWAHGSGIMLDPANPLSFNMSTDPWIGPDSKNNNTSSHGHSHGFRLRNGYGNNENGDIIEINKKGAARCIEDEADSKLIKLAKLSELNDLKEMDNSGSSSSQWLQVGIGSTTEATTDV